MDLADNRTVDLTIDKVQAKDLLLLNKSLRFPETLRNTGPIGQVELDAVFKRIAPRRVRPEGHSGRLIAVVTVSAPFLVLLRAATAQNVPHK
jgi:hypothetical protein